MVRLPQPGSDENTWGTILNDFLTTTHTTTGELKPNVVGSAQLADNAVSAATIADDSIVEANLAPAVRTKLNMTAGTPTVDDLSDVTITSPANGQALTYQSGSWINGTIASGVTDHGALTGLGDDDHTQYLNNARGDARYYTQSAVDTALSGKAATSHTHTASQISDSTATGRSVLMAADAAAARTAIGAGTSNLTLGTTSSTAKAGDYAPTKTDVGLGNVDNTSDATKNSASATLTNKTISGSSNTLSSIPESAVTNLTTDLAATEKSVNKGAVNGYAGLNASSQLAIANIPTGTSSTTVAIGNDTRITGAIQGSATPGGDLSGTYTTPTVSKVNGVSVTGTPSNGQVITASSATAAAWATPKNVYTGEVMYPIRPGGEVNMSRMLVNQNDITLTSGVIMFGPANIAQVTETVTSVSTLVGGTTASGTTFAGYGVYSADVNGNLTRVAQTTNNTGLWVSSYQPLFGFDVKQSLSTSLSKVAGTTYVVGALFVGTTAPTIGGMTPATGDAATSFLVPFRCAMSAGGQTGFPASITYASLVAAPFAPFFALLP